MTGGGSGGFVEVGERCFVARYAEWDVSIGAVVGAAGVVVIDTRASAAQGRQLLDDVRRLVPDSAVRWVVNTHQHFDHAFGNIAMVGATIHAHENAAAGLAGAAEWVKAQIEADPGDDPDHAEITAQVLQDVLGTELRLPDVVFSSVATIDLGDRIVELMHPGRGHTDGDIVVRVPDADVVFGGDLVEQSGPPSFGPDSFPLDWPGSLDLVVGLLTGGSVVVPGHGARVDKAFVEAQRADVSDVAHVIRSLYAAGVPVGDAAVAGDAQWPYPTAHLEGAVTRGYAQLAAEAARAEEPGPSRPTLPLVTP
jgi:glyoxylase-like metal-dependent hydrolase (beta-lactamase superfamily II)